MGHKRKGSQLSVSEALPRSVLSSGIALRPLKQKSQDIVSADDDDDVESSEGEPDLYDPGPSRSAVKSRINVPKTSVQHSVHIETVEEGPEIDGTVPKDTSGKKTKKATKDESFTLDGIDIPVLHAAKAPDCPYKFWELQDKSKILPGWEDGKYRWRRESEDVPSYHPHFLIYRSHPGMRDPRGVAYVYEGCAELLLSHYKHFPSLEIPLSTENAVLEKSGLLEVQPRMYVFYRDVRKSRDPKDDILKLWVTDEAEVRSSCAVEVDAALKARDKLLGEKDKLVGAKKKGTLLERSGRGHGNGQGDRCLTFMQSIETQRGIGHPPANMSQAFMHGDDTLLDLQTFEKNIFGIATRMLKQQAPQDWMDDQVKRFHVNNLPAIGVDENQGFFSQEQINLAGVEKFDSSAGLDKNMGKAGLPHYDPKDDPQGYTCMFATSNFEEFGEKIHPGFFHFLELGLFMKCNNFRMVYFSGLHFHGGCPPRAVQNFPIPDYCIRWNNILYPNNHFLSGTISSVTGVTPGGGRLENKPIARYHPQGKVSVDQGPLNYLRDGDTIMSDNAHMTYVAREIAIILETMLAHNKRLGLNLEAMKVLLLDKATGLPFDFVKEWKYPLNLTPEQKADMLNHHKAMETKKNDICMTVPTQIRRLYNSNQIKLVKSADNQSTLQLNASDPLERVVKKPKTSVTVDEGNAYGHGEDVEDVTSLRRSARVKDKETVVQVDGNLDDVVDEGKYDDLIPANSSRPKGLPWILSNALSDLNPLQFQQEVLDSLDRISTDPRVHSKNALSRLFLQCSVADRSIGDFLQANDQWDVVLQGSVMADAMSLHACILRAQHMLGHWVWWLALRDEVPRHVDAFLRGSLENHWMKTLAGYIHKQYLVLARSRSSFSVTFQDVFPSVAIENEDAFYEARLGHMNFVPDSDTTSFLVTQTSEVIAQWLGMAGTDGYKYRNSPLGGWDSRGWFVDSVLRQGRLGLLLLPEIHAVFIRWRIPALTSHDQTRVHQILAQQFDSDDEDRLSLLEHLDLVISQFLPEKLIDLSLPPPISALSVVYHPSNNPNNVIRPPAVAPAPQISVDSLKDASIFPPEIQAAGDTLVTFLQDIQSLCGDGCRTFNSVWKENWSREVNVSGFTGRDYIIHWMTFNLDKLCPFREFATSRYIFFRGMKNRPYLTASAFFSELVFRGITFNTQFLRDAPDPSNLGDAIHDHVYFKDLGEWMDVKVRLGKEESYYCIMKAYGSPCSQRHSQNAAFYWKAAQAWEKEFGQAKLPIPYASYQKFVKEQTKLKHFYALGDLMEMLILGDLYYAGVVASPSEGEFFTDMLRTDAGSAAGLQILGVTTDFISEKERRQEQGLPTIQRTDPSRVSKAKKLYDYVRCKLGVLDKLHLLPDKFHFEHLLCKVKRVVSLGPVAYHVFDPYQQNLERMLQLERDRKNAKNAARKGGK